MPVQGLPGDAQLLAQIADLGFGLPHRGHGQAPLGGGHLERLPAFPPAGTRLGQSGTRPLRDKLPLEFSIMWCTA